MSNIEDLISGLGAVTSSVEEAAIALAAALQRADEAVDAFSALGGSGGRAQAVYDLIEELQRQVQSVPDHVEEAVAVVREIDYGLTPDENVEKLAAMIDRVSTAAQATIASISAVEDGVSETHGHLSGSSAAEEIAALLQQAQECLEQAEAGLDTVSENAVAQQEAYRGNA